MESERYKFLRSCRFIICIGRDLSSSCVESPSIVGSVFIILCVFIAPLWMDKPYPILRALQTFRHVDPSAFQVSCLPFNAFPTQFPPPQPPTHIPLSPPPPPPASASASPLVEITVDTEINLTTRRLRIAEHLSTRSGLWYRISSICMYVFRVYWRALHHLSAEFSRKFIRACNFFGVKKRGRAYTVRKWISNYF